tara:strand:+ start:138 stop:356 length:219 start_codon:yes stop_codon:yes gene_type:complete
MEKTKYIVVRLAIIAVATVIFGAVLYGLGIIGKALGIEPQHIVGGLIGIIALGMMIFWLSEDYDLQKLKEKK